ncbi:LysM peptidoglycan-binding domain-containing protein [Luteipulveratus mongoliensis]|uniref:LysM domain-containing protein n=1 Tax=Luteipulveratus mongoliensis TaxID=571913 RepID=A0A0K1JI35_9MICO|nr:hypothetical protein [Luteipulveratus mongoliensis]AKU16240.1 hypothetical protein VV02_10825 [Luteipulveratus mongoliensis]
MSTSPGHLTGDPSTSHRWRAGLLGLLGAGGLLVLALAAARALQALLRGLATRPTVQTSDAVTVLALLVLVLALLWCVVLLSACAHDLLRPRRPAYSDPLAWRLAPDLALRVSGLLLAVTALGSGAAHAQPAPDAPAASVVVASAPVPSFGLGEPPAPAPVPSFGKTDMTQPPGCAPQAPVPGWTPDRPTPVRARGAEHVHLLAGCPSDSDSDTVVVHRGDDLWSLVERHLGSDADPARIAQDWPRWYDANRAEIGDDPNLLQIGLTLRIPEGAVR